MARFYFHIRDGSLVVPDDEGIDLENAAAAWQEARASAVDLARQQIQIDALSIDISNHAGVVVGTVLVRDQHRSAYLF